MDDASGACRNYEKRVSAQTFSPGSPMEPDSASVPRSAGNLAGERADRELNDKRASSPGQPMSHSELGGHSADRLLSCHDADAFNQVVRELLIAKGSRAPLTRPASVTNDNDDRVHDSISGEVPPPPPNTPSPQDEHLLDSMNGAVIPNAQIRMLPYRPFPHHVGAVP